MSLYSILTEASLMLDCPLAFSANRPARPIFINQRDFPAIFGGLVYSAVTAVPQCVFPELLLYRSEQILVFSFINCVTLSSFYNTLHYALFEYGRIKHSTV